MKQCCLLLVREKACMPREETRGRTTRIVDQDDLEDIYGPAAKWSEHQRGDTITYRDIETGHTKTGTIIWVCAPGELGGREIGITYVVEPQGGGWPDMVFPADVITAE